MAKELSLSSDCCMQLSIKRSAGHARKGVRWVLGEVHGRALAVLAVAAAPTHLPIKQSPA